MGKLSGRVNTQRYIEVVIRIVAMISCAGAVVAAAFSIDKILDINNCCTIVIGIIRTTISAPDIIDQVNSNIRQRSEATAAMAVVAGLIIPLGIFMIVLRLFKISVGALGRIIVIADILLILLAICGFGVAGVLGAITARDWTEDFLNPLEQLIPDQDTRNAISSDLVDIRNDLAATAACSLLACGMCGVLLLFIIIALVRYNRLDYTGL